MGNKFHVIGSNSFSGAHFVDRLLKENIEVLDTSRSEQTDSVFLPYTWSGHQENFTLKSIDLNY